MSSNQSLQPTAVTFTMYAYEVRPRKDKCGVDPISDALPFGRLWYGEPDVVSMQSTNAEFFQAIT